MNSSGLPKMGNEENRSEKQDGQRLQDIDKESNDKKEKSEKGE